MKQIDAVNIKPTPEEREKFLDRIAGNPIAPTIESQLTELHSNGIEVAHVSVPIHNSENVMPHISDMELDLIVFGGNTVAARTRLRETSPDQPHFQKHSR